MPRTSLLKRAGFASVMFLGLWLGAEAAVSTFYQAELLAWESPPASPQDGVPVMQGNPYLLYEYPPGSHYERGVTVNINELGLRGPAIERPKPAGTVRLYSTGDSSIFGFGVEDTETFTTVAAARLNGQGASATVEPVIGAIPGYSTFQSINLYNLRGHKSDPDLFVIANLWSDNNFDSFVDKEVMAESMGFGASLSSRLRNLFSSSGVFRVLDWRLRVKGSIAKVKKVGWMQQSRGQLGPRRVEINDYAANLERLVDMAQAKGAEAVFVLPANNEDLAPETSDKAWTPYRKVMRDTAARHGAPLIDVPSLFQASGLTKDALFLDEMHPTVAGHRIMGEALAAALAERGWPGGTVLQGGTGEPVPTYTDPFLKSSAASSGGNLDAPPTSGAAGGLELSGTIVCTSCTEGQVMVEAFEPGGGAAPVVVGQTRVAAGTETFSLTIGRVKEVQLRAYIDLNGDGPSAGESPIDLTPEPLSVGAGRDDLVLNLDDGRID